jgi:antirestriction protein ArdC
MSTQAYDRITGQIIALLEQGTVPWHKPWKASTGWPRNLITHKPYRGINVLLLLSMNYESPHWLTFRQAIMLGGTVKKGEKASPVVFWKRIAVGEKDTTEEREIPLLRYYSVFNLGQCDGIKNGQPCSRLICAFASLANDRQVFQNWPVHPRLFAGSPLFP